MSGKIEDLTGRQFGRWTVVEFAFSKDNNRYWKCKCICGNEKNLKTGLLNFGESRSCGCLHREISSQVVLKGRPREESGVRSRFTDYKSMAKSRKLEFSLTYDEFKELVTANCFYCTASPNNNVTTKIGEYNCSGVDRIDNNLGYITGNVCAACDDCNTAKNNYTLEEFKNWIKAIYHNLNA